MNIQFYTYHIFSIYDLFSYFCSILEKDVLYLVLFSIIFINIIQIILNSSKIIKGLKDGIKVVALGVGAQAGSDLYQAGKKIITDSLDKGENKPKSNTGDNSTSNQTTDNSSSGATK